MRHLYFLALVALLTLGCLPEHQEVMMETPPCNTTTECPEGLLCCLDGVCRESCSRGRLPDDDLLQTELNEGDVDGGRTEPDALPEDTGSDMEDPEVEEDADDAFESDLQNLDGGTDIEPDMELDTESDVEPDETTEPDMPEPDVTDPDVTGIEWACTGDVCIDGINGLMWEQDSPDQIVVYADAEAHCDGLLLGGHSDWRVPTVTELRTLIRGCDKTEPDGQCSLSEWCPAATCNNYACQGCDHYGGPGPDGCYWPDELGGALKCFQNWSSTTGPEELQSDHIHWNVGFYEANVPGVAEDHDVAMPRCVRGM